MIEQLIVYFAVLMTIVYGVCASALLWVPRVVLSAKLGPAISTLVYCPVCVGTWVALGLGFAGLWPHLGVLPAPAEAVVVSVVVLHLSTVLVKGFLVAGPTELSILKELQQGEQEKRDGQGRTPKA